MVFRGGQPVNNKPPSVEGFITVVHLGDNLTCSQLSPLTLQVTLPAIIHRPFQATLCHRLNRFKKYTFEIPPNERRELVAYSVVGECDSLSATVNR
jgi:hypothetical protein